MLKFIFLYSIENISKVIVWNSNHLNLVNDNAIEVNFDDFVFEILHFSLVRKFDLINMSSIDFPIYSLRIKLMNVYNSNKETHFRKYVNLRYIFNWYFFIWFIYKNVSFQKYDNSRRQFIWYCIIKIVNDT